MKLRKKDAADAASYVVGSAFFALSVNMFSAPNHLAPGGATGLATLLQTLTGLPIGTGILLINLPLLAAAWMKLGHAFTLRTAAVTVLSSIVIDAGAAVIPPFYSGDLLLVAIVGGVLSGVGLGLIYLRGATTGGSEVAARLMERRWPHIPVGRLILAVDSAVVALSAIVYRTPSAALYAAVQMVICSSLLDRLIAGSRSGKLVMIVTVQAAAVTQAVFDELERGVTHLSARGGYSDTAKSLLLCAVRPIQVPTLRRLVRRLDPTAFVIVTAADEVMGEGFIGSP